MDRSPPRAVTIDDLEFRAQSDPKDHQCLWIPYLKGHAVMEMFDEWLGGPGLWKDHYEPVVLDGLEVVKCWISVLCPVGDEFEWVTKENVGSYPASSYGDDGPTNRIKGGYSDAFKRCASRSWGVGRTVYDLGPVWAACSVGTNGKAKESKDTLPEIRRKLSDRYGIELAGDGLRTKFGSGATETTSDDNPFPPDHGTSKRPPSTNGAAASSKPSGPLGASRAFSAVDAASRGRLKGALEEKGWWPLPNPTKIREEPGLDGLIVDFIEAREWLEI